MMTLCFPVIVSILCHVLSAVFSIVPVLRGRSQGMLAQLYSHGLHLRCESVSLNVGHCVPCRFDGIWAFVTHTVQIICPVFHLLLLFNLGNHAYAIFCLFRELRLHYNLIDLISLRYRERERERERER